MVKQKVYISSTFLDLKNYRALMIQIFNKSLRNEFELVKIMEYMTTNGSNTPILEECLTEVKKSTLYILILGTEKGSAPGKEDDIPYTQFEYDTALASGKFILRFVHKDALKGEDHFVQRFLTDKETHRHLQKREFKDSKSFMYEFQNAIFEFRHNNPATSHENLWAYLMSGAIVVTGALTTFYLFEKTRESILLALIPCIFLCFLIFILKDIIIRKLQTK